MMKKETLSAASFSQSDKGSADKVYQQYGILEAVTGEEHMVKNNLSKFCTCTDLNCPLHPTNHDRGCSPCIAKNLKEKEIPSCFFNIADPDGVREEYKFEDFAKAVME